jgi:hypothetical protein
MKFQNVGEICIMRSFKLVPFAKYNLMIKSRRMKWAGNVARMGGGGEEEVE